MKQSMRCRIAALAVTAAACVGTLFTPVGAHAQTGDYQIFPTPQKVAYQEGSVEFADIKQELADFRAKLSSDTVTAADVDKVSKIFLDLL